MLAGFFCSCSQTYLEPDKTFSLADLPDPKADSFLVVPGDSAVLLWAPRAESKKTGDLVAFEIVKALKLAYPAGTTSDKADFYLVARQDGTKGYVHKSGLDLLSRSKEPLYYVVAPSNRLAKDPVDAVPEASAAKIAQPSVKLEPGTVFRSSARSTHWVQVDHKFWVSLDACENIGGTNIVGTNIKALAANGVRGWPNIIRPQGGKVFNEPANFTLLGTADLASWDTVLEAGDVPVLCRSAEGDYWWFKLSDLLCHTVTWRNMVIGARTIAPKADAVADDVSLAFGGTFSRLEVVESKTGEILYRDSELRAGSALDVQLLTDENSPVRGRLFIALQREGDWSGKGQDSGEMSFSTEALYLFDAEKKPNSINVELVDHHLTALTIDRANKGVSRQLSVGESSWIDNQTAPEGGVSFKTSINLDQKPSDSTKDDEDSDLDNSDSTSYLCSFSMVWNPVSRRFGLDEHSIKVGKSEDEADMKPGSLNEPYGLVSDEIDALPGNLGSYILAAR